MHTKLYKLTVSTLSILIITTISAGFILADKIEARQSTNQASMIKSSENESSVTNKSKTAEHKQSGSILSEPAPAQPTIMGEISVSTDSNNPVTDNDAQTDDSNLPPDNTNQTPIN